MSNRDEAIRALKPCPFCGGAPPNKNNEDWDKTYDPDTFAVVDCNPSEADNFWVECEICQTGTRICGSEEEAIEAWNQRDETETARLRADLAAMTAERDAAVRDIPQVCDTCKHDLEPDETSAEICGACGRDTKWEWRGPVAGKEGA